MRYLLFAGDYYYPNGGWQDFQGYFNAVDTARVKGRSFQWHHVVDSQTSEIVEPLSYHVHELAGAMMGKCEVAAAVARLTNDIEDKLKFHQLKALSAELYEVSKAMSLEESGE